jgi:signal transduction histidine kinase/ligand-binding sensor domain-containing protein
VPRKNKVLVCVSIRGGLFIWIALACALLWTDSLRAETRSAAPDYSFDNWQTEDGLPQNSVTCIVQSRDGYLWLGTYNGLVRFDGVRFTVFETGNTPQLRSSRVTSLFEDSSGDLWIGHETGDLTRLHEGAFSHVELGNAWPGGQIIAIDSDENGTLWLLNYDGWLFSLEGGKHLIPNGNPGSGTSVPSLVQDKTGKLWIVRGNLIGALAHGKILPASPPGKSDTNNFQKACFSHDGGLWLVDTGRLKKWIPGGPIMDRGPAPWGQTFITSLAETRSGDLLAGTFEDGLYVASTNGTQRHFNRRGDSGLSSDWVRCIGEDREGSVWIGTGGGGLDALRTRKIEMVKVSDDWQGRTVLSVSPSSGGGLWVGTEGAGLYRIDQNTITHFGQTNGLANAVVWSVLEDQQRQLWVGTWGGGLFVRHGDQFQPSTLEDPSAAVLALHQDHNGALWIGTSGGLAQYVNGTCTRFTRKEGLILPDVRVIAEDAAGTIWFGMSGGGLGRLQNGKVTQFRKTDGLASDFVWSLHTEEDGTLWIGTFGGGLSRLKQGRFSTITSRQGLPNDVICRIADDGLGNFWMSSYGGIFRIRKDDLRACADGNLKSVPCLRYGRADGLSTLECSGGCQASGCSTPDGRLWFPTTKGLAVIDPADVKINPKPPPVLIEEILIDNQTVPIPQLSLSSTPVPLRVGPGRRQFEFHYTGLSLVAPKKVRFKYRLDGLESEWLDAATRRIAYYSFLKPGDYTFHVIACNNDNVWNETGATLALTVLPYFWQTWWFTAGMLLAGAGSVGGGVRYVTRRRLRRKMERLEHQRAVEKERARIAKDIHDDLGASLTRITLLSQSGRAESEDPQHAATDLDQIYRTARELTRAMDEIVWAVSPQHDTLDSLVNYLGKFAQDFLSVAGIRCRLDVPMLLPPWPLTAEVRHNLFLAFKEALNNVIKHAAATQVTISLSLSQSGFSLLIADNGKGFALPSPGLASTPPGSDLRISTGNGLPNMRKRLEEIGGLCEITTAPGEGTRVKFTMEIKNPS